MKKDVDMSFRTFKDTFRLIGDRSTTESPTSSSVHSSIPEMSKLEERQLQRSFHAIQRPETPTKEEESGGHFNLTFRDTISDRDANQTAPKTFQRQQSEDSDDDELFRRARSSGMFKTGVASSHESVLTVGSADSSFVQVTPRDKIGASADMDDKLERLTDTQNTQLWDVSPESSVHVIPQHTRERTPDSTALQGSLVLGGNITSSSAMLNRNKLDQTMRDQIRGVQRVHTTMEETSFSSNVPRTDTYNYGEGHSTRNPLGQTTRLAIRTQTTTVDSPDTGGALPQRRIADDDDDDAKIPPCWPRCLAVGVGLAMLLAAIVALIVVFDDRLKQEGTYGSVIDDPISYQECPDITVNLADSFNIDCMFAINHDTRVNLTDSEFVVITKPDGKTKTEEKPIFTVGNWTSELQVTASCATIGSYGVKLQKVPEYIPFTVKLAAPTMVARLEQVFFNDTNGTSEFHLGCNVSGDCTRYKLDIIGVRGLITEELNDNLVCVTHSNNTHGTTIACNTTLSEDTFRSYTGLRCKISSDGRQTRYENFRLPECGKSTTCRNINCTEKSPDRTIIDTCRLGPNTTNECFQPGRKIYSYCKDEGNLCDCRMNWCQLGSRRITNERPIQLLCGSLFEQPSITQRPTTKGPEDSLGN